MKTFNKFMMLVGLAVMASLTITSCKVDEPKTNPLDKKGVNLVAFGPNPVARGGYMRFMGTGMDQIASVTLAGQELTIEPVSSEEFKTLIPQDAKIGDVVLKTKAGEEIVGKRQVTYTEPVGFDAEKPFDPATIKAGKTLTINGEYLNLVTKVIFADGVEVTKFKEKDRKHIVIENFPAEAQTGKVTLSFVATGDTMAQEIPSEVKLDVVLPTVKKIAEFKEVKAGQVIVIAGDNLDLVTAALSTTGDSLEYIVLPGGKEIDITMPEVVMDGTINIVVASGIQIPVATIGVALPKVSSVEGNKDVKEGSIVTINGTDMTIVSGINFVDISGNAITVDGEKMMVTDTKVTAVVPANAVTGAMVIKTTANIDVTDTTLAIVTLKPALTEFVPAEVPMGGSVFATGTNFDLVKNIQLAGGAVVEPYGGCATYFHFDIPYADAETGKITLNMANGETVTPEFELTINPPLCAYVVAWPELVDGEPVQAGTLLRVQVANRDKLTKVEINGEDCAFLFNGDDIVYISIPESAGANSKVKLISEGLGEIEYDYTFKPNTEVTYVLWSGIKEVTGWTGWEFGKGDGEDPAYLTNLPLQAGDVMRIWISPVDGWTIQFNAGDWTNFRADEFGMVSDADWPTNINAANADVSKGYVELPFDGAAVAKLLEHTPAWAAFVINGDKVLINKIDLVRHISLEVDIKGFAQWMTGEAITYPFTPSWSDGPGKGYLFRSDLQALNLKAGKSKVIVYKTTESKGQLQWCNPSGWGALTTFADWDGTESALEWVLNEDAIKCVSGDFTDGSDHAFYFQGDGMEITKITILP